MPKGKENVYVCSKCGKHFVTIDRDEGATPFMMRCGGENPPGCGAPMCSQFYPTGPRPPHIKPPTHEWYAPTPAELDAECKKHKHRPGVPTWIRAHVRQGGLLIRAIPIPYGGVTANSTQEH